MKLTGSYKIDGFIKSPDKKIRAILLYGPDQGMVKERAETLGKHYVPDLNDPFQVVILSNATLKDDPMRLMDEAASISFMGGSKLLRIPDASDQATSVLAGFLEQPVGDTMIIVQADELGSSSSLRKLFEKQDNAMAIGCYAEEGADLDRFLQDSFRTAGFQLSRDALAMLRSRLPADRLIMRNEIEKICLYADGQTTIQANDVEACLVDAAENNIEDVVYATANGDVIQLGIAIDRCIALGESPIAILNALARHVHRLLSVLQAVNEGAALPTVISQLRPPIFFKRENDFKKQCQIWNVTLLQQVVCRLTELDMACKNNLFPDAMMCKTGLFSIARLPKTAKKAA